MEKKELLVYIGTYTEKILFGTGQIFEGQGEGIHIYRLDPATGSLSPLRTAKRIKNPSYLAFHPNRTLLYAVNELKSYHGQATGTLSAFTLDPHSGYEGKALPAAYHGVRSVMKDCLPTDDQVFPLIYSLNTEDRFCRIGDIEGPDVDAAILRAGTGLDWDTAELERAAERVLNLERAISVRHFARTRAMDERVIPYFEYDENWVNPEIGERKRLDRDRFLQLMDEYYRLRGWDVETGWPTKERLEHLGLDEVHRMMAEGATAAQDRLPTLPPEEPVLDVHGIERARDQSSTER